MVIGLTIQAIIEILNAFVYEVIALKMIFSLVLYMQTKQSSF